MTDLQMVGLEDREKAAVRDRGKIREEGGDNGKWSQFGVRGKKEENGSVVHFACSIVEYHFSTR